MESDSDVSFDGFSEIDELEYQRKLKVLEDLESDISVSDSDDDSDDDVPLARLYASRILTEVTECEEDDQSEKWTETLRSFDLSDFTGNPGPVQILSGDKKEIDFFKLIFTDEMITQITLETNRYAQKSQRMKSDPTWRNVSELEIRAFIGFNIVMGVLQAPNIDMYWSTDSMFNISGIKHKITRSRYDSICKYFHVCDNTNNPPRGQPGHDKLALVRPIMEEVRKNLLKNYNPHKEVSIDEAMIAYTGRLGFKQYVPLKPTKRGIKVWMRADPHNGYVNDFQVYCGKEQNVEVGLGERVVLDLSRDIWNKGHHIYCDNYFTSIPLFQKLLDNRTYACGTLRTHRKGVPAVIKHAKLKEQGQSIVVQNDTMTITAWKDKRIVNILSTNYNPTKETTVQRRQKDGSQKEVRCPEVVRDYTQHMNGVDRADQLRATYTIGRKSAKWWKYLFWFLVDISVVGSYILMKESPNHKEKTRRGKPKPLTQLDFRKSLAKQLVVDYCQKRKRHALKENMLSDGSNCWIKDLGHRKRCKMCSKKGIRHETKYGCESCNVNLCRNCFKAWHVFTYPERYTP